MFSQNHISTNDIPSPSALYIYPPHSSYDSLICSDEGLTLETSALNFSYGGKDKGLILLSEVTKTQEGAAYLLTA